MAKVERQFIGLPSPTAPRVGAGGHPCQGVYTTLRGQRPRTAFIATHYNVDFAEHYIAPWLAARGYGFLGWNTRFRGAEDMFLLEHAVLDIGVGMRWLRE
ncbi:MAG: alpha/beta hydrolase, partial [bacterium]